MQYNMYHKRPLDAQNAQPSKGAAGHGDRGAILAGAAVLPPGPRRIIAQMLGACGIQTDRSQHYTVTVYKYLGRYVLVRHRYR